VNNILITSAGRRVGLVRSFQTELKKKFPTSKVYTAEANPQWSSACRISDGYFTIPRVDNENYINSILGLCKQNEIKIVIPTIDTELLVLSSAKNLFSLNNIEIVVSDFDLISKCRDKRQTNLLFNELTIDIPSAIEKKNPSFPLFIKPYDGSLSKDIYLINCKEELADSLLNNPKLMFMEYIDPKDFYEYTIDAYYDKNSILKCLVPRRRIEVRGGEISKGKTEKHNFYNILKDKLGFINGAKGCLTIQFFIGKETEKIIGIEINPRFGGGFPLSYASGANYPGYIIQEYIMNETIDFNNNWIENRVMLRFDSEVILDQDDFTY
jgi:carbamoyl-phosphate synthase large subunit